MSARKGYDKDKTYVVATTLSGEQMDKFFENRQVRGFKKNAEYIRKLILFDNPNADNPGPMDFQCLQDELENIKTQRDDAVREENITSERLSQRAKECRSFKLHLHNANSKIKDLEHELSNDKLILKEFESRLDTEKEEIAKSWIIIGKLEDSINSGEPSKLFDIDLDSNRKERMINSSREFLDSRVKGDMAIKSIKYPTLAFALKLLWRSLWPKKGS